MPSSSRAVSGPDQLCATLTFPHSIPTMSTMDNDREACSSNRARSKSDSGFTLIELLITIVLISTTVLSVLGAVQTNIIASARSRSAARVESVVVNVADRINRAPSTCDYSIYATAAALTEQWPATAVSLSQKHYKFQKYDPNASEAGAWEAGACASELSTPPDLLVQRIAITVTSPDGKVSRTIEVVKSDV